MLLYLIRHAESTNNELYTLTGGSDGRSADPPLTELGHRQAQRLARFLAAPLIDPPDGEPPLLSDFIARHDRRGFGLTHLYCSLMTRAIQTGSYIATATGLPISGWINVHEHGGLHHIDEETGEDIGLPGPGRAWFEAEYPHLSLPDNLGELGWWNRPKETITEARARARAVWAEILDRHGNTDDRVAIVTHGGFFQSLLIALISDEDSISIPILEHANMGFGMSNASISRFEVSNGRIVARYINRVDHLPDELITG